MLYYLSTCSLRVVACALPHPVDSPPTRLTPSRLRQIARVAGERGSRRAERVVCALAAHLPDADRASGARRARCAVCARRVARRAAFGEQVWRDRVPKGQGPVGGEREWRACDARFRLRGD
eukprot:3449674-Prymnesium_polylepis.1